MFSINQQLVSETRANNSHFLVSQIDIHNTNQVEQSGQLNLCSVVPVFLEAADCKLYKGDERIMRPRESGR